jgi:O-antigen/teichoic acid export membrane protein
MSTVATAKRPTGRHLVRNTAYNIVGQVSPSLVAVFAVPMLVHGLGVDRFALLTLIWMVIGYFSLFDFGMSRALTHAVADRIGRDAHHEIEQVIETAMAFIVGLGALGCLSLIALSPWLVGHGLNVPVALRGETLRACLILACGIPFVILSTAHRGVLEAYQRFDIVNAIRVPMGVFNFVAPVCLLPFTHSLVPIAAVIAFGRVIASIAFARWAWKVAGISNVRPRLHRGMSRALFTFSSWIAVSNLIGPIMSGADRVIMGALLPIGVVAYYSAPQEVISKSAIVAVSMAAVLFPAFAMGSGNSARSGDLFMRGMKMTFALMFPIALIAIAFSSEALTLWLGADFARNAAPLLRWQAVAVFISTFIQVPFAFLQGSGRPDLTGKLQVLETPFYLAAIWFAVGRFGASGAAATWAIRTTAEVAISCWLSRRLNVRAIALRPVSLMALAAACGFLAVALPGTPWIRYSAFTVVLVAHVSLSWFVLFGDSERTFVSSFWNSAFKPKIAGAQ